MKYILMLCIAIAFAGCRGNDLEITGTANGIADATITLKNEDGTRDGVNLKDGRFHIPQSYLERSGYYTLEFAESGKEQRSFEIYLDPGKYTISFDKDNLAGYPIITSSSSTQNQLSTYHAIVDSLGNTANERIKELKKQYDKSSGIWTDKTTAIADELHAEEDKQDDLKRQALLLFIAKQPKNTVAAHIMRYSMYYESSPAEYYKLYQKFSDEQKNTTDGQEIGELLKNEVRLVAGAIAPAIAGVTPDGKVVDVKGLKKKLVLIEFWRAGSYTARENHQALLLNPMPALGKELEIISVSMDTKRDWWLTSVKDDKLPWIQVSDLKGNESPNVSNWRIADLPTYYLLDGQGRIIERNLPFTNINFSVTNYLQHH